MTTKRAILVLVLLALIAAAIKLMRDRPDEPPPQDDEVDEWGKESFPASDPPSHW